MVDETFEQPAADQAPETAPDEVEPDESTPDEGGDKPKRKRGRPRGSRNNPNGESKPVRRGGWRLGKHGWEPDV